MGGRRITSADPEDGLTAKGIHPVDVHVGGRVRGRRKELGVSQSVLAEGLGLSFQQVQKYERGANRISASALFEIAKALNCDVNYFFEGLPGTNVATDRVVASGPGWVDALATDHQGRSIGAAFMQIPNPRVRRALAKLARALVKQDDTVQTANDNE